MNREPSSQSAVQLRDTQQAWFVHTPHIPKDWLLGDDLEAPGISCVVKSAVYLGPRALPGRQCQQRDYDGGPGPAVSV